MYGFISAAPNIAWMIRNRSLTGTTASRSIEWHPIAWRSDGKALAATGDAWFAPLVTARPTIIHGEFYAKTVLVRGERLFMVDWESVAIAPGEIDLATLTEGKHFRGHITRQCGREYARARWPVRAPADFQRTLDAARIYLHFRWLGERPDWAVREKTLWRYEHLHAAAKRFGWPAGRTAQGRGIGLAGGFEKGSYVATCAEVAVDSRTGRITVVQPGDFPVEPSTDRRIPLAIIGTLGGAALGIGIVLLSGVVRGGYRSALPYYNRLLYTSAVCSAVRCQVNVRARARPLSTSSSRRIASSDRLSSAST